MLQNYGIELNMQNKKNSLHQTLSHQINKLFIKKPSDFHRKVVFSPKSHTNLTFDF